MRLVQSSSVGALLVALVGLGLSTAACGTEVICYGDNCATGSGGSGGGAGGAGAGEPGVGGQGAAGGWIPEADLCEKWCACIGCDNQMLMECQADLQSFQAEAVGAGCSGEFDLYFECLNDSLQCEYAELVETFSCDEVSDVLFACMEAPSPPPSTVCDVAASICGGSPGEIPNCEGTVLCAAQCIVAAGHCEVEAPELTTCITNCP